MRNLKRHVLVAALAMLSATGFAQTYPNRAITIVVPFTPGGAVDAVARTVASHLSTVWEQPVLVDNRAGAGGAIGAQHVARSSADGYTLLLGSIGPMSINPSLQARLPYDPVRHFEPIALLAKTPAILVVQPNAPANNVSSFVSWLKNKPDRLNYGSAGTGNVTHLVAEYFMNQAGIKANHIPYKGSSQAVTDLLGGQLDFMFDVVPTAQPYVKSGQFKALAVTTLARSRALPQVPTLDELGYKGFDVSSWFGLFAPAGTPRALVDKINAEVVRGLQSGPGLEKLHMIGAEPASGSPDEFKLFLAQETQRWKKVIQDASIKAE
ncbi:Bug family tripartite tricarboxylate transporter substrate binding protein [Hydrogenophaga palleronii]|uniref:Bug family tripartite tricarboxylate transporter substrate binding protein n=1 Tax=Hydrogenophaga palleronii TaxID=65655 RepID=UPI00082486E9|nr:tripartite tricarboxylate transporter substrate binding protein [Hydrogenophaga palleronii]